MTWNSEMAWKNGRLLEEQKLRKLQGIQRSQKVQESGGKQDGKNLLSDLDTYENGSMTELLPADKPWNV